MTQEYETPTAAVVQECKRQKSAFIGRYAQSSDRQGLVQTVTVLVAIAALWGWAAIIEKMNIGMVLALSVGLGMLQLRVFVLMHDCGHGSLFRSVRLNKVFGFVFGVLTGMPQYVWSKHHNYHHVTNGDWEKYRGPLSILSVDEYDALSPSGQRWYVRIRHVALAPLGGLIYLLVNPRLTWIKGTAAMFRHAVRYIWVRPRTTFRAHMAAFKTRYWATAAEYRHMTLNNLVLLTTWVLMVGLMGPARFFSLYVLSMALAGGIGLLLFAVQHNFEHSYATAEPHWDYDMAALQGTSFLVLPGWLNWFTANIGYHHIHHLSARIPNYRLTQCHAEHEHLFATVTRLRIRDIQRSLRYILWDPTLHRLVTVAGHESSRAYV